MIGHRIDSKTKRKYDHLRNSALQTVARALDRQHTGIAAIPPRQQGPIAMPPRTAPAPPPPGGRHQCGELGRVAWGV